MAPVRARLAELIPGVDLLDNLRFDPGEEAGDPAFVDRLVAGQDHYVDDAFGSAHRAHASIVGPPTRLPSAAGRLLAGEVEALSRLVTSPRRPFVAVLGGAKISDKLGLVAALLERVDTVVIGGAMCFTFLAADGQTVGDSAVEWDRIDECRRLLSSGRILLPTDFVVARSADSDEVADSGPAVPDGWAGRDIGPESSKAFAAAIAPGPALRNHCGHSNSYCTDSDYECLLSDFFARGPTLLRITERLSPRGGAERVTSRFDAEWGVKIVNDCRCGVETVDYGTCGSYVDEDVLVDDATSGIHLVHQPCRAFEHARPPFLAHP